MIAVDAMGGDFAPLAVVKGALEAVRDFGVRIVLVGRRDKILECLSGNEYQEKLVEIIHAADVVTMDDTPTESYYRKPNSSVRTGLAMLRDNEVEAFVSASNTGALVYSSIQTNRLMPGIVRPAIVTPIPTSGGYCLLLDSGANVDSRPQWLLQFAIMGHIYSNVILGMENPSIGLLSNGTEKTKGNRALREAYSLLNSSSLNFAGNVEPSDIFSGKVNIVVCDGFVGNVFLKSVESFGGVYLDMLRNEMSLGISGRIGSYFVRPAIAGVKSRLDFASYGGMPLLGINGNCVVCHGKSSSTAIKNAIKVATDLSSKKLVEKMGQEVLTIQNEQGGATSAKRGLWTNIWHAFIKGRGEGK